MTDAEWFSEPAWLSVLSETRQAELRQEYGMPGWFRWHNANPTVELTMVLIREIRELTQELRRND